ncbi:MAG TPA: Smr/MutS family protein [Polyangiales bacterium]|nr:Smr/MutS family protein [Polyangiales bacterium]
MTDEPFDPDAVQPLPMDGVLDLHSFAPRDVADLVPTWLDACQEHKLYELRIVHGKGRGVLQRTVHAILARRSDVESYRLAPPERGGWGATLVTLRPLQSDQHHD